MNTSFRDITGADRGFNVGADVVTTTVDGISLSGIWEEFQTALTQWNTGRSAIAALFTANTTDSSALIPLDGNRVDFQQASEFGQPVGVGVAPGYLRLAFPLDSFDLATRFTRKFLQKAPAEQIRALQVAAQEADNRLVFNKVMSSVTTPTGGTWGTRPMNDEGQTIYSLYAGAADDKPPTAPDNATFAANHTHFLVSGTATVDSSDLEDVMSKVTEHGRGLKSAGETLVVLVNKQEGNQIRKFRAGEVNNNAAVATFDFIPSAAAPAYLTDQTLIGDRPPTTFNGLEVLGSYGDALIVQHPLMKAGYMVAVAAGGNSTVGFRQSPVAAYQGLNLIPGNAAYPLVDAFYERQFGVGVWHREAAAVIQIKASGTYDVPIWS
ncbi:MAG TPA: hypothetical protein VFU07_07815 [Candidatus Lumbricidophila sp.]|nr:hypothetical protein [Candidatus Lumbricidophila sp.]